MAKKKQLTKESSDFFNALENFRNNYTQPFTTKDLAQNYPEGYNQRYDVLKEALKGLPNWLVEDWQKIDPYFSDLSSGIMGYVENNNPSQVNFASNLPMSEVRPTLIHELEHTRQIKSGGIKSSDEYPNVGAGAIGNRLFSELKNSLLALPKEKQKQLLASNAFDNMDELFANISEHLVTGLAKGQPLDATEFGKAINLKDKPELKKWIYQNTLQTIPRMYEGNVSKPTGWNFGDILKDALSVNTGKPLVNLRGLFSK